MYSFWVWLNLSSIAILRRFLRFRPTRAVLWLWRWGVWDPVFVRMREREWRFGIQQSVPHSQIGVVPWTWGLPGIWWHSHLCKTQLPATLTALCVIPESWGQRTSLQALRNLSMFITPQHVSILSLNTFCYNVTVPFYAPTLMQICHNSLSVVIRSTAAQEYAHDLHCFDVCSKL